MTDELKQSAGTSPHRMSPAAVGSRALSNRETLREVADLRGALGLASKIIDERGHTHSQDWLDGEYYLSCLLNTCGLAAAHIYGAVADVVGEGDYELEDGEA